MKWPYIIQQKTKLALSLGLLVLLVLLSNLLGTKHVGDLSKSFASFYKDRLIPTTEIVYLTDHLYTKRLLLEHHLLSAEKCHLVDVQGQLQAQSQRIDSLIQAFEGTSLVDEESRSLSAFKGLVAAYARLEEAVLAESLRGDWEAGRRLFETQGQEMFQTTVTHLHKLTQIHSAEGKELIKDSETIMASSNILSHLQLGLGLILGLIVQVLVLSSRIVKGSFPKINLN